MMTSLSTDQLQNASLSHSLPPPPPPPPPFFTHMKNRTVEKCIPDSIFHVHKQERPGTETSRMHGRVLYRALLFICRVSTATLKMKILSKCDNICNVRNKVLSGGVIHSQINGTFSPGINEEVDSYYYHCSHGYHSHHCCYHSSHCCSYSS